MQSLIKKILEIYPRKEELNIPYGQDKAVAIHGKHEIRDLFEELKRNINQLPSITKNNHLMVKSSYGAGGYAAVPWVAIMDTRITTSTQTGTYIVFLFAENGESCDLKIGQGVTEIQKEFKSKTVDELKRRAEEIRQLFPEMQGTKFSPAQEGSSFESDQGKLYGASTILSVTYKKERIPANNEIESDLNTLLGCYEKFTVNFLKNNEDHKKIKPQGQKMWAIATGEDGSEWGEFLKNGIVAIGFKDIGSLDQYKTQDEITQKLLAFSEGGKKPTNDSLCMHQFAKEIQVGDIVVAKSGRKIIRGVGVVISEYIFDSSNKSHPHIRKIDWKRTTATEFPDTGTAIKTLTEISRYPTFKLFVESYLNMHTLSSGPYGVQQIIDEGCFASSQEIQAIIERLKSKKNIILQGPPGTGKTWLAKRLGYALIGEKNLDQLKAVQFHPNLSYEDFVRGWRPSGEGKLSLIDGPFMEAINKAKNSSSPYVVVIEEINRGNPAQIFGEMLTLLESDKRNADEGLELSYRKSDDERVYIPENLYVIGTMNIADRSLALVDLALRRRFAFIDLKPNINSAWKSWLVDKIKIPSNIVNEIQQRMISLNDQISKDQSLGSQYQIGHSYVTPTSPIADPKEWFKQVVQTEIYPLLNEYWFDNPDNAIKIRDQLLQDF